MKILPIALLFAPLYLLANDFTQYQVNVSINNSHYKLDHAFLTTGDAGGFEKGNTNGYLDVVCKKTKKGTSKKLSSKSIFSGYKVKNIIKGNTIHLQIEEHIVKSQDKSIQELDSSDCKSISAEVVTYLDKVEYSLDNLPVESVALKNGKTLNLDVKKI
jgi:hypothetical protein